MSTTGPLWVCHPLWPPDGSSAGRSRSPLPACGTARQPAAGRGRAPQPTPRRRHRVCGAEHGDARRDQRSPRPDRLELPAPWRPRVGLQACAANGSMVASDAWGNLLIASGCGIRSRHLPSMTQTSDTGHGDGGVHMQTHHGATCPLDGYPAVVVTVSVMCEPRGGSVRPLPGLELRPPCGTAASATARGGWPCSSRCGRPRSRCAGAARSSRAAGPGGEPETSCGRTR